MLIVLFWLRNKIYAIYMLFICYLYVIYVIYILSILYYKFLVFIFSFFSDIPVLYNRREFRNKQKMGGYWSEQSGEEQKPVQRFVVKKSCPNIIIGEDKKVPDAYRREEKE